MICRASIIICTRNRCESLDGTLAAIARLEIPEGLEPEVLVVDNASSDQTAAVVARQISSPIPVRRLLQPRIGKCFSANAAIAATTGGILAFTDDDVRPTPGWLREITAPVRAGAADLVAGSVRLAEHLCRPWMQEKHRADLAETSPPEGLITGYPYVVSASMACSRALLSKVPAFDVELGPGAIGFGDDVLFGLQAQAAGCRVVGAPAAVVIHHFDEGRLRRSAFLDGSRRRGRAGAYLAMHWQHRAVTIPRIRLYKHALQLGMFRLLHPRACRRRDGMPAGEMQLVEEVHFFKHYLSERKRELPRQHFEAGQIQFQP